MSGFPSSLPAPRIPDPANAPTLRWGILAPGGIAGNFAEAALRLAHQQVVAVGGRSRDRAQAFAQKFGIERAYGSPQELVDDPNVQAVYVASPHNAHHEQARLALDAGKHVLVEKAFTQNATQARDLITAAGDLTLMEAMWTRFLPGMDVVRQLLADGVLGEVATVIADHGQYFDVDPDHRLFAPGLAGGALLDLGVYPISFASFALGAPDRVTAVADPTVTGVDGQVSAVLRTQTAHALVNATLGAKTPTTATISGSAARIEIPGVFYSPSPVALISRTGDRLSYDGGPIPGHAGFAYEIAHFASLVTSGQPESPLLPRAETLSIMDTMDEIRRQIGLVYPDESAS